MKHGRFETIEGNQEVPQREVIVDVRSRGQIFSDWLSQPKHFSFVMLICALLCFALPVLLPVLVFALVIFGDIYGRAVQYLPIRYPAWSPLKDPGDLDPAKDMPTKSKGIMYFGVIDAKDPYERSKQVFASADDLTRHMLVLGTTGSGKSEFLKGMTFNVLCWASGFFVSDAKADNKLPTDLYSQVRMFARDYDFLVVNYLLGGLSPTQIAGMRERLSNGLQPATAADADTLVQMTSNMMVKASGDSKTWQERGLNLFKGITRAVCYKRDEGQLVLSMEVLREYLSLDKIEELYIEGWKLANDGQSPWPTPYLGVKSYLEVGLPGFKIDIMLRKHGVLKEEAEEDPMSSLRGGEKQKKAPTSQSNDTYNQHGYRSDQVYPALSLLIDTYGHIFKRKHPEVDMQDVVINNRICVSLIPSLEKGSQEQESLGKLNLALLRVMMARALGMSVEGDVQKNVDAKITASATPFALFLDEFAYQFAEGIALTAAQARSLNFFLCALAQDLEKLTEGDRAAEAGAMMANQATKFFMKIIGSDKTHELAAKTLGEAQVAVLSDMEKDTDLFSSVRRGRNFRFEKRPRIERQVLESLPSGFATFAYRQRAHVMRTFYPSASVPRVRYPRINRFLQIPELEPVTLTTCAVDLNPTEDTLSIERVRRVLGSGEAPDYSEVITSDILQRIIAASKGMKPQTPAIERGIVLYQAGIQALGLAKHGASMLGVGGGSPPVKPGSPASANQDVAQPATSPTESALVKAVVATAGSGNGVDVFDIPATPPQASGLTNAAAASSTAPASAAPDERSAAERLDDFDPLLAIMNIAPPIVRKPKEEVFDEADLPVSSPAGTLMAEQTPPPAALPASAPSMPKAPAAERDERISADMLDSDEVPLVMGDPEFHQPVSANGDKKSKSAAVARPEMPPDRIASDLQEFSRGLVDPEIVANMGQEVVGLRETSMQSLAKLEQVLGASPAEAQEAAMNTEKVIAQSLSILDNNKISATASDLDLLFNELNNLINQT